MCSLESKPSPKFFSLVFLLVSSILSIGNWHIAAQFGIHSIFYLIFASVFFMVPVAFVACELASSYTTYGGLFVWIKDAFGIKIGVLCAWLMWVSNIVWYPTVFTFISTCLIYYFEPSFAQNRLLTFGVMNALFWLGNMYNFFGFKFPAKFLSFSVLFSMILPAGLLIGFGIKQFYAGLGQNQEIALRLRDFFPTDERGLVLFTGLLLGFTGMEMAMVHYDKVHEPKKYFPKAIWLATLVLTTISILGTLGISQALPKENMNLITDSFDAIYHYLKLHNMQSLMPFITFMMAIGTWFAMSAYISEPSKAFFQAVKSSGLSKGLAKSNHHSMPTTIMICQGCFVTSISIAFYFFTNLSDFYWLLTDLASQLYLMIYFMMFMAVIKVKVIKKIFPINIVPFGSKGIVLFSSVGMVLTFVSFFMGCLPPHGSSMSYPLLYSTFVVISISMMAVTPLLILKYKNFKKSLQEKKINQI
jgi:amino acid transporter